MIKEHKETNKYQDQRITELRVDFNSLVQRFDNHIATIGKEVSDIKISIASDIGSIKSRVGLYAILMPILTAILGLLIGKLI